MEITLQKILEDYWSEILLFLTWVGFLLRMVFAFFLKKKELNHGIIHKNRMEALIRFFNAFAELKSMWIKLPIFQILKNELPSNKIDELIQPPLNKFEASIIELQIYFDEKIYDKFKSIEMNMLEMNGKFLEIAHEDGQGDTLTQKTNNYSFFRLKVEKENANILKEISQELSKKYK